MKGKGCIPVTTGYLGSKDRSGFTTIELIVVLSIIGILGAAVVILNLGNDNMRLLAEARSLRANLRFAQAKAMTDSVNPATWNRVLWGLNLAANSYSLEKNDATPNPAVMLPGSETATYNLPGGVAITGGTGRIRFDFRGRPVDASGNPLNADTVITLNGGVSITVTQDTGFVS
jgi:prepilin-type N-terminal cleavage/methylation domain-containing protein